MGDLGNVIGATQIRGRWSNRLLAEKLSPGSFGLLQQYPPESRQMADVSVRPLCADAVEKVANDLRERFHLAF
jgi:hypothetical protein